MSKRLFHIRLEVDAPSDQTTCRSLCGTEVVPDYTINIAAAVADESGVCVNCLRIAHRITECLATADDTHIGRRIRRARESYRMSQRDVLIAVPELHGLTQMLPAIESGHIEVSEEWGNWLIDRIRSDWELRNGRED